MLAHVQNFIEIWVKIACEIDFGREISVKICEIWAQMNEIFKRNLGACGAQFWPRASARCGWGDSGASELPAMVRFLAVE